MAAVSAALTAGAGFMGVEEAFTAVGALGAITEDLTAAASMDSMEAADSVVFTEAIALASFATAGSVAFAVAEASMETGSMAIVATATDSISALASGPTGMLTRTTMDIARGGGTHPTLTIPLTTVMIPTIVIQTMTAIMSAAQTTAIPITDVMTGLTRDGIGIAIAGDLRARMCRKAILSEIT
jgi:hypothetical protein